MADIDPIDPPDTDDTDPWIPDQPPADGPDPDVDHPDPTEPPAEPVGYGLADILVTIDSGEARTLEDWGGTGVEAVTVSCTSLDGTHVFDFDDTDGRPADVVVYTNGRPA